MKSSHCPARSERRSHLDADEAAADDHRGLARRSGGAQPAGIGDGAQHERAIGTPNRWPPRLRTRRKEALPEGDHGSVVQDSLASGRIQPLYARSEPQIDRSAPVPRLRFGEHELVGQVLAEELLAQGRTVVGRHRLVSDEQDGAGETVPAQRAGAADGRHATANQQDIGVERVTGHRLHASDRQARLRYTPGR